MSIGDLIWCSTYKGWGRITALYADNTAEARMNAGFTIEFQRAMSDFSSIYGAYWLVYDGFAV